MAGFDNPLHNLEVTAQSHDGSISATLSGGGHIVHFRIHPRAYRACREETLESQLGALLRDIWNDYRRRYFEALSHAIGTPVRENEYQGGTRERRFRQEWRALAVEGTSPDRSIRIRSTGLQQWQVRIRQGTLRRLSETEFTAVLDGTLSALMADYREKMSGLRDEIFGLNSPKPQRSSQWR